MSSRRFLASVAVAGILTVSLGGCVPWALLSGVTTAQPVACATNSVHVDDSAEVDATVEHAMPESDFWAYIDILDGQAGDAGFARLSEALAAEGLDTVLAFDARLALALYSLDGECAADWYQANEPMHLGFVSEDTLLYARCDTIVAGRDVWQQGVSTKTLPWGSVDGGMGLSEPLLYVGQNAAEEAGVGFDDYLDKYYAIVAISYETGGNPNGWPAREG